MDGPRRSGRTPAERSAGDARWRPAPGYLALALGIVGAGLAYGWMSAPPSTSFADARSAALPASAAPVETAAIVAVAAPAQSESASIAPARPVAANSALPQTPTPQVSRARDPNGDLTPDISDYVNSGEQPTMGEVIDRLHQAGVHGGLGAFTPPGTRPPLIGLAVPDDFVLPPGYVRHHQATDDGQRIEAILMFAPGYQPVDAAGHPLAVPKDRVVPPELAPPGLPIRRIVLPAPAPAPRPGS